jgi:5-methyltetrahydropteroyltriglutamate--homocysteine methyltransferase
MLALLRRACELIPPERLWVNPDCGLKTRGWPETEAALRQMVNAASAMRRELGLVTDSCAESNEQAALSG